MKKKGFTLIELIAVLVIMAILALIVTPLVMSIIRKAKISADKRSIDAYGRSIELAIASYLLDNGAFPQSIDQLTIEYSGDEVVCSTTRLNSDSTVYLTGCTVGGRSVDYEYGSDNAEHTYVEYKIGDYVSYNNVTYYVIEDSGTSNDTVKLLKERPLTNIEMGMSEEYNGSTFYGDSANYSNSNVKQYIDFWKSNSVKSGDTAIARLISLEDLRNNLGCECVEILTSASCELTSDTPSFVFGRVGSGMYVYWTMSQYLDSSEVWGISDNVELERTNISYYLFVRPVLELNKSADITKLN